MQVELGQVQSSIAAQSLSYHFIGPTTTVTLGAGESMFATGQALIGPASGATTAGVDICWRPTSGPGAAPVNFAGGDFINYNIAAPAEVKVVGTAAPEADQYTVGICVRNTGAAALDDNGALQMWVMVIG